MSNRPKITGKKPKPLQKIKTPSRLRFHHHVGDMAGCGTIRVIQPSMLLNSFYSRDYQFEAIYNNRYNPHPTAYNDCSFVTFQRSCTRQQFDVIRHFKQTNPLTPVLYELDDDLFNIPIWNFASEFYGKNKKWIESILRFVDGIIVSTEYLRKSLLKYNKNIIVSPNHLPRFIWGDPDLRHNEGKPRIMYAGSHNHFDTRGTDVGDFSRELLSFVKKTSDKYEWVFVGGVPHSFKDDPNIEHHEWKPVFEYPSFLKSLKPDICLAPLEINNFNRAKSNIKALEANALGVPLIATDIEPYHGLNNLTSSGEEMISQIETLAADPDLRSDIYDEQHNILKNQMFWEDDRYHNLLDYVDKHLRLCGKKL